MDIDDFNLKQGLIFKNSTWCSLCCECFVRISEQTATFALYIINWLVFITVVESVHSAVRTDSLYTADCVSSSILKAPFISYVRALCTDLYSWVDSINSLTNTKIVCDVCTLRTDSIVGSRVCEGACATDQENRRYVVWLVDCRGLRRKHGHGASRLQ
jgi:hypothetical protein